MSEPIHSVFVVVASCCLFDLSWGMSQLQFSFFFVYAQSVLGAQLNQSTVSGFVARSSRYSNSVACRLHSHARWMRKCSNVSPLHEVMHTLIDVGDASLWCQGSWTFVWSSVMMLSTGFNLGLLIFLGCAGSSVLYTGVYVEDRAITAMVLTDIAFSDSYRQFTQSQLLKWYSTCTAQPEVLVMIDAEASSRPKLYCGKSPMSRNSWDTTGLYVTSQLWYASDRLWSYIIARLCPRILYTVMCCDDRHLSSITALDPLLETCRFKNCNVNSCWRMSASIL